MATRRTTLRSRTGTKLDAVPDESGKVKDIQTDKRAHTADMRHKSKAEKEAARGPVEKQVRKTAHKVVKSAAKKKGTAAREKPGAKTPAKRGWPAPRMVRLALKAGKVILPDPKREGINGPDPRLMRAQAGVWNLLVDYYFRLEIEGWERLPERPSLLVGIHSGGALTMDAWTLVLAWWRRFEERRILHGTAHDALMKLPGLGAYFRRAGVISPSPENIAAAFAAGHDVVLWPGGEVDSFRKWTKRDQVVLGGRKGFIRLAIRAGVPIVPVASVGGHDTFFVLSEGRGIAEVLGLKKRFRTEVAAITLSVPFGITLELLPAHIPLPAKIRTEFLEPVELDPDPERADDDDYVDRMYRDIEGRIQSGVDRLAKRRKFFVFG